MIEKNTVILDLEKYEELKKYKDNYENLLHNMIAIDKDGGETTDYYSIRFGNNIFSSIDHYEISINDLKEYLHINSSKLILK